MPTKLCRKLKFERLSSHTLCALNGNRSHFSVLLNLLRCELIVKRYDAPTPSYFLRFPLSIFINTNGMGWKRYMMPPTTSTHAHVMPFVYKHQQKKVKVSGFAKKIDFRLEDAACRYQSSKP